MITHRYIVAELVKEGNHLWLTHTNVLFVGTWFLIKYRNRILGSQQKTMIAWKSLPTPKTLFLFRRGWILMDSWGLAVNEGWLPLFCPRLALPEVPAK